MGREGPCFHCGIKYTPLWRNGPPDKPVLCNACGSRWRIQGSLAGYIPNRAIDRTSPLKMGSINGSHRSKVSNPPVPKRKRSVRQPTILSPIERFQWQLYCLSQEPQFSKLHEEQEEDLLIYHKSSNQIPNEIGLGAVLLKPPTSPNN